MAIIAAVVFIIIKKRNSFIGGDDADVVNETNSSVTTDNALASVMDKDDPFAEDF